MTTKKELAAKKRNWLLFRLTGAQTIFSMINRALMQSLIDKKDHHLIDEVDVGLGKLIDAIKEAKS